MAEGGVRPAILILGTTAKKTEQACRVEASVALSLA